jgi:hypothetical protein
VRHLIARIESVERKGPRDLGVRVFGGELVRVEEPRLHLVVEARDAHQQLFGRVGIGDAAAGHHRQAAERQCPAQQPASCRVGQVARGLAQQVTLALFAQQAGGAAWHVGLVVSTDDACFVNDAAHRPRSMATMVLGTSVAITT